MTVNYIVEGSEPFYLPGGPTCCLLMHGFTAMPEETRLLGKFLADNHFTVLGVRLSGHATHPNDLKHTLWTDWMDDVQGGLALFEKTCIRRVLIGQSMGGMIALTAARRFDVSGVIAISTPYGNPPKGRLWDRFRLLLQPTIDKGVKRFPTDHPLYHRRELNYPAYPEFPAHILRELSQLSAALTEALPEVKTPALLIHSTADASVPFDCLQAIYDHIGSTRKEKLVVDGMDHSILRDPLRQQVFVAILAFLSSLE